MIRQATERDVRAMNRLRLQVHENMLSDPNFVTEAMTADAISASGRGWVYEQDRKILGFSIALHRDPSIWALFVHPDHEGRGIGHALHEAAVNWLWVQGARGIWLSTEPATRAERFYRERGWTAVGTLENGDLRLELHRQTGAVENSE
jgi:GNAT superfamily N-acetyltransferase